MNELETLKEELTYSINKFRKFSTSKDNRLVKYSEQERYILLFMYENLKHDSGNSIKREKILDKSAHDRNNGKFAGFNFNASFRAKINYKRLPGRSNSENHRIS